MKKFSEFHKVNEEIEPEGNYDYTNADMPITKEMVINKIQESIDKAEGYEIISDEQINLFASEIMFSFHEQLSYFDENYEGKIDELYDKAKKPSGLFEK